MRRLLIGSTVLLSTREGPSLAFAGKSALLLAFLGLETRADRRRLASLLWPDSSEARARNNLRVLVHRINQRCGHELLSRAESLALTDVEALVLDDADAVLEALHAGGAAQCELLCQADLGEEAGDELRSWLAQARQRLRRRQLAGLGAALTHAEAQEDHPRAVALARACVQLEPLSETPHRKLMEVLARSGDRAGALAAYEACKALLKQELGVLPDVLTRTVQLRILQEQALGPPPQAHTQTDHGLTPLGGAAKYPLVERQTLLQQVHEALSRGVHVALQGEPGAGKTRVLRQLAGDAGVELLAIHAGAHGEAYSALAQLLQELQPRRDARLAVADQMELARLAPLVFAKVQPATTALSVPRLHTALRQWVRALREAGVKRLVIDDLHYADAASQAALGTLLPGDEGPALVLACRSGEIDAALEQALVDAQARRRVRRVEVPRLTLAGIEELLRAMDRPAGLAPRLLQRTGGNPLFVIEMAEATAGADTADLQALLAARLARCSAQAEQLAAVAAVAGEDFAVELAATVTGQTVLGLMPAWAELQQRGLFADHGLAHDLVREAVLNGLPVQIRRQLHRQVARYLEGQGLQGSPVLRHWVAADDPDQAIPHATLELYAASARGFPTARQEMALLRLLERASDPVLLANVWLTAELYRIVMPGVSTPDALACLEAIALRVQRLPATPEATNWLVHRRAWDLAWKDGNLRGALELLSRHVETGTPTGICRAHFEVLIAVFRSHLGEGGARHVQRARAALAELPPERRNPSLVREIDSLAAVIFNSTESFLSTTAALRSTRRSAMPDASAEWRGQVATALRFRGHFAQAYRHFALYEAARHSAATPPRPDILLNWGVSAIASGRFRQGLCCFERIEVGHSRVMGQLTAALAWLRMGCCERAATVLEAVEVCELHAIPSALRMHGLISAELSAMRGEDRSIELERLRALFHELGIGGLRLRLMDWELSLHTAPAEQLVEPGLALLNDMREEGSFVSFVPGLCLQLAEACAASGHDAAPGLTREAARSFRRGRHGIAEYVPDALVRCAALLEGNDPAEAAALRHVARRWVLQALPNVPPEGRQGFVHAVSVNKRLLLDDPQATPASPLLA